MMDVLVGACTFFDCSSSRNYGPKRVSICYTMERKLLCPILTKAVKLSSPAKIHTLS